MAHVDLEQLHDPERVFVGRTLRQAKKVEALLTDGGVDYAVAVEPYGRSFIFGTVRHGAAFYVAAEQAPRCRAWLVAADFGKGVVERPPHDELRGGGNETERR